MTQLTKNGTKMGQNNPNNGGFPETNRDLGKALGKA
jgi:hypothetical protein